MRPERHPEVADEFSIKLDTADEVWVLHTAVRWATVQTDPLDHRQHAVLTHCRREAPHLRADGRLSGLSVFGYRVIAQALADFETPAPQHLRVVTSQMAAVMARATHEFEPL